jgi:acyl dehydratase
MTASRFPIEAGHVMAFARAIGDFNPVYHDPDAAATSEVGGLIAPPTFVQASAQYDPDYPLRPRPGVAWFGSGRTPSGRVPGEGSGGAGGTGLHAEQHYEYHRPVRPGEVLSITVREGASWEKQGRRGGLLQFRESITEYRGEDGALVVVARSVGVRTDRTVAP